MKKTILSIALAGAITGFASAQTAADVFKKDFEQVLTKKSDPFGFSNNVNGEIKRFDINGDKISYEYSQATDLPKNDEFEAVILSKGDISLSSYLKDKGSADIKAEIDATVKIIGETYNVPKIGKLSAKLDNGKKMYEGTETYTLNDFLINAKKQEIGKLNLKNVKSTFALHFNDDYSKINQYKNQLTLDGFSMAITGIPKQVIEVTLERIDGNDFMNLIGKKEFVGNYILKKLFVKVDDKNNNIAVELPKSAFEYSLLDENEVTSKMFVKISHDDIKVHSGARNSSFGKFEKMFAINGFSQKNGSEFAALINKINSLNPIDDQEELNTQSLALSKLIANSLTEKTELVIDLSNKAVNNEQAKFYMSIKPKQALIEVMKDIENNAISVMQKSVDQIIDSYLNEFTLKIVVPNEYVVEQYVNGLKLREDINRADAEKMVSQGVAVITMAQTLISQEMVLIKHKNNESSIDLHYKDAKWDINGGKFTTKELIDILSSSGTIPFL